MDMLDMMLTYEQGELGEEESITFFQELVNDGTVWLLQGSYGRTARDLIEAGLVTDPNRKA